MESEKLIKSTVTDVAASGISAEAVIAFLKVKESVV